MSRKKLLLLGGSRFLLPVIKAAHELGIYTITCDYLPDNYAHRFSDEYKNVSIVDKEAVLAAARELKVDGVMSFACDPGVVTAAYVAEKMGLPSCGSYESACILQNKGLFRKFLKEHGFNVPTAESFTSADDALRRADMFKWPVIVKPVDSAGSKGVKKVDSPEELKKAVENALAYSRGKEFIVEDYLEKIGCSSDADCFSVDGEFQVVSFSAQRFDANAANPYVPAAFSWPATISAGHQKELTGELQRLISLLGMRTSIYNVETRECSDGNAYIMEVSPRGGGNRLAEMHRFITGADMITNAVRAAVGLSLEKFERIEPDGYWAEVIVHSEAPCVFQSLWMSDGIRDNIHSQDLWVAPGDAIGGFSGANEAIGTLILKFKDKDEMEEMLREIGKNVRVIPGGG